MTLIDQAIAAHQRGNLAEAEALYRQVLGRDNRDFDALHMLGIICAQRQQFDEAERLLHTALTVDQKVPPCYHNYGNVLSKLKRYDDAIQAYDKALALAPTFAPIYSDRGSAQKELGRFAEALASIDKAIALNPNYAPAHYNRGVVLEKLNRNEEALIAYDRAIALVPNYAEALSNRGAVLGKLNHYAEALASCDRALAIAPNYVFAHYNRGVVLSRLKKYAEALESIDRAIALDPNAAFIHDTRGVTLEKLERYPEAIASYDRALALDPTHVISLCNRSIALRALGRFEEALATLEKAQAMQPDSTEAHWNESQIRLLLGDFARGWPKYEWRWKLESNASFRRDFSQPLWLGAESIEGKTILIHAEQGLGDSIQFCRYVSLVAARGARVILEVDEPLKELMYSLSGVTEAIAKGDTPPSFDVHCPLVSLPFVFATRLETIPSNIPYLSVAKDQREKWQRRLGEAAALRVAISWAGNPNFVGDQSRSIGLRPMLRLCDCSDVQIFSIQKDLRPGDAELLQANTQVVHLGHEIETFSDTAAIMSLMDLVIASDTSVVHLAGAFGVQTWTLLQHIPDWRWLLDRPDSPWYTTMRLFRQPKPGDWDATIAQVIDALSAAAKHRNAQGVR